MGLLKGRRDVGVTRVRKEKLKKGKVFIELMNSTLPNTFYFFLAFSDPVAQLDREQPSKL
jgi:hypothetical protein